jgi:hypothetical protein
MHDDIIFNAFINPLAFLEVDKPWATVEKATPDYDDILSFLCAPEIESDINSLVKRYKEISNEPKRLFAAPLEENILTKLIWPLRYAKGCYMLGNYLGTISLCGMVAEMTALLIFEISSISINGRPLDNELQKRLFGSGFEKLGQERRVAILNAYNLIDDKVKSYFDTIREIRRQYLHLYSKNYTRLAPDAVKVFNTAAAIVVEVIGQDIKDGKIILKPALLTYLHKKGIVKPYKDIRD